MITTADLTAALTIAAAGVAGVVGALVVYWLFFVAPNLSDGYGPMREINTNDTIPNGENWQQARLEHCPPGSICLPSRDNLITSMYNADYRASHTAELQAQYEQDASIRATPDGIDHGAEGSSLDDSRRQLSAEDAALLLGYGQQYRDSLAAAERRELPSGDDYIDTTWRESGDREALHW